MTITYLFAPIIGYLAAGSMKFAINTLKSRKLAFSNIGMGGMPSTHNTITSTTFFMVAFGEGFNSSIASVALMVCMVVAIDSMDLRKKIEKHAVLISQELGKVNDDAKNLRTKLGHNPVEVIAGWALGTLIGYCLAFAPTYFGQ